MSASMTVMQVTIMMRKKIDHDFFRILVFKRISSVAEIIVEGRL